MWQMVIIPSQIDNPIPLLKVKIGGFVYLLAKKLLNEFDY